MERKYNCIIVDDEPKAIQLLAESITGLYDNIEISGTYNTWKTALEALRKKDADIVFMDISMPHKTGIDLLELVPQLKSEIIFVTAYTDYALSAFSYNTAGYVLKPVKDKALATAIDKALEKISYRQLATEKTTTAHAAAAQRIAIASNNGFDYFSTPGIILFEATSRYTKVVTQSATILSSYSIGKCKELLQAHTSFFQAHRSFIVNLDHIKRYERHGIIIMCNGSEVPLSKNLRNDFLKLSHIAGITGIIS